MKNWSLISIVYLFRYLIILEIPFLIHGEHTAQTDQFCTYSEDQGD